MFRSTHTLFLVLLLICGAAGAQDDLKADAVRRVVEAHDTALFVATGALYLKQEAIRANGGRALSPALATEVDRIIRSKVQDPAWFRSGWQAAIDRFFSAEEADEIATHFTTEAGRKQRRIIELAIAEVLMSVYTFTDRIDYRLPGCVEEMAALHRAAGPRRGTCDCPTPQEKLNLDRSEGAGASDLSGYPAAVKFASGGVGVKYMKMLMIQGIAAMTDHFEAVAREVRATVARQGT